MNERAPGNLAASWEALQLQADRCTACSEFTSEIAYPRVSIGIPAPPEHIDCLFISWNPPTLNSERHVSDNFWNTPSDILRHNLLDILRLGDTTEFLGKNYFLVHALKCATKSAGLLKANTSFSRLVLGTCVRQYLEREVITLAAPRICLLGGIAKEAVASFCQDVRDWPAKPRMGENKEIRLPYGTVDCLYTCLPIYRINVPYTRDHLSKWL